MNSKSDIDTSEFDQVPKSARSLLLENYYGMLRSALTVQDVRRMHNAIIKHLSDEIYCLYEEPLPEHLRVQAAADLECCREKHSAAIGRLNKPGGGSREAMPSSAWLHVPKSARSVRFEEYYARLRDVHDVDEAIALHTKIINELSAELHALETEQLPVELKLQAARELERRQKQHAAALGRLTGIQQRSEQVVWRRDLRKGE